MGLGRPLFSGFSRQHCEMPIPAVGQVIRPIAPYTLRSERCGGHMRYALCEARDPALSVLFRKSVWTVFVEGSISDKSTFSWVLKGPIDSKTE